jgi:hypothetical protein
MNQKFNINFCKYAYGKKNYNDERCCNCNKTCPSISNLSWKIPIIKEIHELLYNIYWHIQSKKYEKDYIDENETTTLKHIWGIKSGDDLTKNNCCLYTMNDFDITYNKDTDDYSMSVETIYIFEKEDADKQYIKEILKRFTEWMISNNYDTNKKLELYEVFTEGNNINTNFKTIEDCYTYFKLLVNGYCSQ